MKVFFLLLRSWNSSSLSEVFSSLSSSSSEDSSLSEVCARRRDGLSSSEESAVRLGGSSSSSSVAESRSLLEGLVELEWLCVQPIPQDFVLERIRFLEFGCFVLACFRGLFLWVMRYVFGGRYLVLVVEECL